jgi:hypothetical protein
MAMGALLATFALSFAQPMRPPRYALEPVAKLRDAKVDEAACSLAAAVTEREAAERACRAAEARREAHEAAAARARAVEREALDRGELCVGDLARADGWEVRVAAQGSALTADVERAGAAESRAREAEQQAQRQVAERRADAEVIARDRARWEDGVRRRIEAKEEEEAAEAYRRER